MQFRNPDNPFNPGLLRLKIRVSCACTAYYPKKVQPPFSGPDLPFVSTFILAFDFQNSAVRSLKSNDLRFGFPTRESVQLGLTRLVLVWPADWLFARGGADLRPAPDWCVYRPVLTAPVSAAPARFATVRACPGQFRPVKTASKQGRNSADGCGEDRAYVCMCVCAQLCTFLR